MEVPEKIFILVKRQSLQTQVLSWAFRNHLQWTPIFHPSILAFIHAYIHPLTGLKHRDGRSFTFTLI